VPSSYWYQDIKPKGQRPLGYLDIDGRIILKWHLGNRIVECGLDSFGLKQGLMVKLHIP
jgi:hypothetical protein